MILLFSQCFLCVAGIFCPSSFFYALLTRMWLQLLWIFPLPSCRQQSLHLVSPNWTHISLSILVTSHTVWSRALFAFVAFCAAHFSFVNVFFYFQWEAQGLTQCCSHAPYLWIEENNCLSTCWQHCFTNHIPCAGALFTGRTQYSSSPPCCSPGSSDTYEIGKSDDPVARSWKLAVRQSHLGQSKPWSRNPKNIKQKICT